MIEIGGNLTGIIQSSTPEKNEIGVLVDTWQDVDSLTGFLDLSSGDAKYTSYNAKVQESTHVFIADYKELNPAVKTEQSRMQINGKFYDIMLIDDPMELHDHYEIYLKFTGGQ